MAEEPVYRIDKFTVPAEAKERFLERLKVTHRAIDRAEGCEQNLVMEQTSGTGVFNIVTFVKWRDGASFERAKRDSLERHNAAGFDPKQFMDELGVTADLGNYAVASLDQSNF